MKLNWWLLLMSALTSQALTSDIDGGSKDYKSLRVQIGNSTTKAVLSGTLTIPCHITYQSEPEDIGAGRRAVLATPRVKWTYISNGKEVEIVVARGHKVKISEGYKSRASLPEYSTSAYDATLVLKELISNDSGIYRCHVQHGIEDDYAMVEVKVKGVVFLYREGINRYAYTFPMAQEACTRIKAYIATADQLLAAYHGGYEQCDAGWIADQTVRYPIQTPREGCYGDMDGFPGVRNYGVLEPEDLYDVYCYVDEPEGQVFLSTSPMKFTLGEAKEHCRTLGTEIATTGQLYAAWSEGLDQCNPGWLADGSVRYPIVAPRERCGGNSPGVKTIFQFRNQTGFPNSKEKYDVYCFKGKDTVPKHDPLVSGDRGVITVTESFEELKFLDVKAANEAQGLVDSIPLNETHVTKASQEDKENTTVLNDQQGSPPSSPYPTTPTLEIIVSDEEDLSPAFASFPPYEDHSDDSEESTLGYTINMPVLQSSQEDKVGLVPENNSSEPTGRAMEGTVLATAGDSILSVTIVNAHAENVYDNFTGSAQEPGVAVSESANYYPIDENPYPTQFPTREHGANANTEKGTKQGQEYNTTDDSSVMSTTSSSTPEADVGYTDIDKKVAILYDNQPNDTTSTTSQTTTIYMFPTMHPSIDHFEGSGQEDHSLFSGGLVHPQTTQGSVEEQASGDHFSGVQDPIKEVHLLDSSPDLKTPMPPSSQPKIHNSSKLSWEEGSGDVPESTWIALHSGPTVNTNHTQKHETNATVEQDDQHNTTHTPVLLIQGLYGSNETSTAQVSHLLSPNTSRVHSTVKEISVEQSTVIGTVESTKDLESNTTVYPTITSFTSSLNNPRNSSHHNLEKNIQPTASLSPTDLPAVPTEKAIVGSSVNFSDVCYPNPCENGGTCIDEEDGEFRCLCLPGYFGRVCDINVEKCLEDWDTFQGFCYKHFFDRKSWQEAETQCREYGGHLVSIVTPEEQDFVNNKYKDYQWTGLNDRTIEGDFQWSDGNPLLFENWKQGQPDSYFLSGEDCVVMGFHDGGLWSDVPCNYHLPYTCKMGLVSCGPPPEVANASIYGRPKKRYPISSVVGYRCDEGFVQRNLPVVKCQSDGVWEEPQINCLSAHP